MIDSVTREFAASHRATCAQRGFGWSHGLFWLLAFEGFLYLGLADWRLLATVVAAALGAVYLLCVVFRLMVVTAGVFRGDARAVVAAEELAALDESSLPVYTVLVPLYREANVAESIVASVARLEYPPNRLDAKLLLEADDAETIAALAATSLPPYFEILTIPESHPRTKPKACNHGLRAARGEYVVIYDAEDRPEADQLKKAVAAFCSAPTDVACLQAKLNFYNADENQLTRWFTIEYTMWFEFFLPGLRRLGAPIPLGGTSNHFRADVLRRLGGWDPFNVTEDCELGVRIYRQRMRTLLLDSTTWEEANGRLGNWVRQRSRWTKGFLQTHVAHTRNPFALLRSLGLWRTACFLMTVGWMAAAQVVNLGSWLLGVVYVALLCADVAQGRSPLEIIAGDRDSYRLAWKLLYIGGGESRFWSSVSLVCFTASSALLLANVAFIGVNCLACTRPPAKQFRLSALSCPAYWFLISLAAVRGAVELFTAPFHWSKTEHGLAPRGHVNGPGPNTDKSEPSCEAEP